MPVCRLPCRLVDKPSSTSSKSRDGAPDVQDGSHDDSLRQQLSGLASNVQALKNQVFYWLLYRSVDQLSSQLMSKCMN